jgi:hypothetical protein
MKTAIVLPTLSLALCACSPVLNAQEVKHAPTVEQCRADQKLWLSKEEEANRAGIDPVSYKELDGWEREMFECEKVDPDLHNSYYNTLGEANSEQITRLEHFLRRHNLYDQFIAEDEQGKR